MTEMDDGVRAVLAGNFDVETLPDVPSRVIKVYLSSTLTDTVQERIAVAENVYLRLRNYCKEKYGLEFQLVDLRWGRREEWTEDHPDSNIFHREISNCQNLSAGPSFVALIGQHYGNRPLPSSIVDLDFHLLRDVLSKHRNRETRDASLLDKWYQKDTNVTPNVYRLRVPKPGENLYEDNDPMSVKYKKSGLKTWEQTKARIGHLLHKAVEYAVQDNRINDSDSMHYLMSDLEREIRQGLLLVPDPHDTCLAFVRNIVDLKNYVPHQQTSKFVELSYCEKEDNWQVDPWCEKSLQELINKKVRQWLPTKNVFDFEVLWRFDKGIDENLHREYLNQFCETFFESMCNLIDNVGHSHVPVELPPMVDEAYQSWNACKLMNTGFCREVREGLLQSIHSYVTSKGNQPLILHGKAGCGKSSLVAQAATQAPDWLHAGPVVIIRFLDARDNTDIRKVFYSICQQVASLLGQDESKIPKDFKELNAYYISILSSFPMDRTLVIFLDSLEFEVLPSKANQQTHLGSTYDQFISQWLPLNLKDNVKIIFSVDSSINDVFDKGKDGPILDDSHMLEVCDLPKEECFILMNKWLEGDRKSLTPEQRNVLRQAFNICGNPLYLRLVFQHVRTLTSYQTLDENVMALDVQQAIHKYLDYLEAKHGNCLVSHSLSYMVASKTGLSDNEMDDVLSLDDEVLNEVFPDWEQAKIRRCPSLCWARLKTDLHDFLVRHDIEGVTAYFWNHAQFVNVCKSRYMDDEKVTKETHSTLAEYFLGTWNEKLKPYPKPGVNNNEDVCYADRQVPSQPLIYVCADGNVRFNKRMYSQVPKHLFFSGRLKEFNDLVLFKYEFIFNKAKALSLEDVLSDFAMNPGVEATLVEKALKDAQVYIEDDINCMPCELTGRLLSYYSSHPNIHKLLSECGTMGLKHCSLIPHFSYHQIPGSPLKYSFDSNGIPTCFNLMGEMSRYLLAKDPENATIRCFDLETGELKSDICTSIGEMFVPPNGEVLVIVDHMTEKAIKLHNIKDGSFLGQLIPLNQIQLKPKEKYRLDHVTLSNTHIGIIVSTDQSYLCLADLKRCKFLDMRGLNGRSSVCEITPDSNYVFCNSNDTLLSYDLNTLESVCNTNLEHRPKQLVFCRDVMRGFMINDVENKIYVLHLREGNIELIYKIVLTEYFKEDSIQRLNLSNNQELLLVQGKHILLVYHVSTERVICSIRRPEDIPDEFKLPRSHYRDIHFTSASFSSDNKFVIGSIFRNIYVWHSANGRQLTSVQAPVGVIEQLLVPDDRGQIITHLTDSNKIHVWGLGDAIGQVSTIDHLTRPVEEILVTNDDARAFVKCEGSDEVGVLDMKTGQLEDLFTHPSEVVSFSTTPDGKYLFVSIKPNKPNTANNIWYLDQRKIIYEFGKLPAYSLPMQSENTIISIMQQSMDFKAPYYISLFNLNHGTFEEYNLKHEIKFVLSKPFVTPQDKYLVILSAEEYQETRGHYKDPTICAISLQSNMAMSTFSAKELQDVMRIRRILQIKPMHNNSYTIIVFFTNEPDTTHRKGYDHCHGFLIFDICSGVVCQVIDDFLAPSTPMDHVIFARDVSICLDDQSNIFDMGTGYYVKQLSRRSERPQCLALGGKVTVYYSGSVIYVLRIQDGHQIGYVDTHHDITCLQLGHDERTIVAGGKDGAFMSYVIIDSQYDDATKILASMPGRQTPPPGPRPKSVARIWDKVDSASLPAYSRPPSTIASGPSDREMLRKVKPVPRTRPSSSDTTLNSIPRSQVCSVM